MTKESDAFEDANLRVMIGRSRIVALKTGAEFIVSSNQYVLLSLPPNGEDRDQEEEKERD